VKNLFKFSFFTFIFSTLLSCSNSSKQEIKIESEFSVFLSSNFFPEKDSSLRAAMHYSDSMRNISFIVISESKDSMTAYGLEYNLKKYFDKTSKSLMSKLQNSGMNISYPDTINGKNAMLGNIKGESQGEKLFYRLIVIETQKNFYQLIWAMLGESPGRYETEMNECIYSFKEL